MLFNQLKKCGELQRLKDDALTETRSWETINPSLEVWIYARTDQEIALHDGNFSKSYSGRVAEMEDVREGDRILFEGTIYSVNGVRVHHFRNVASRRLLLEVATDQND